jgi:hypothetical protein
MTRGPDGNIWLTVSNLTSSTDAQIVQYVVASGALNRFALPNADANPNLIVTGSDGNLWFFEVGRTRFARLTPNGTLTEFPVTYSVDTLVPGVDGNLWFLIGTGGPGNAGKITPAGATTVYALAARGGIGDLSAGPNGRMWMVLPSSGFFPPMSLASFLPDGSGYATVPLHAAGGTVQGVQQGGMAFGSDGNFQTGIFSAFSVAMWAIAPDGTTIQTNPACSAGRSGSVSLSASFPDGSILFEMTGSGGRIFAATGPTSYCGSISDVQSLFAVGSDGFIYATLQTPSRTLGKVAY